MIVYLAGPINGCTDAECMDWRNYVTAKLGKAHVLNPMDRDYRGVEDANAVDIVEQDKTDIDRATHVLVYYDRPSVGTSMEMLYAWERDKTVIIVTAQDRLSPWLVYHSRWLCRTLDEAIAVVSNTAAE